MTPELKQLLIELHTGGNSKTKEKLEQAFPELFQPFENGDWIKKIGKDLIIRITDFANSMISGGFYDTEWTEEPKTIEQRLEIVEQFINEFKNQ